MDSSIRHVSDLCEPSFFSAVSISPLSLFFTLTPIQKFQKLSLTLSLPTEHASESLSHASKKSHQWCSGYLSTEEWMWTNSVSATHPNVIRSGNQIYEIFFSLCDFFAKDHPFVSFIALKIIYFFHYFFLKKIWFIYCWMFLRFL